MRSVNIYQQTFFGLNGNDWDFKFSRIYKSRPENKLIIRVIQSLVWVLAEDEVRPYFILLTNGAEITGKCNQYIQDYLTATTTANPFVLGVSGLGGGGGGGVLTAAGGTISASNSSRQPSVTGSPTITVNDLPLNKMKINLQYYDNEGVGAANCFVMFEIEEIEEV